MMDGTVIPTDDGSNPPPGDGGNNNKPDGDSGTTPSDAGDAATAPPHGKVILVHGSAHAPSLRFCYGSVQTFDGASTVKMLPVNPSPNTALGVPPGTGGPGADTSQDLATRSLEVYAINAAKLTTDIPDGGSAQIACDKLLGSDGVTPVAADAGGLGLVKGVDYWDIGNLPAGTLADNTTTLIVVNGCVPGLTTPSDELVDCPTGYDPSTGDLGMWTAKLDTTTPLDAGSIGAQFAYASQPFTSVTATMGGVAAVAGFYVDTLFVPDAGAPSDAGDAGDAAVEAAAPVVVPVPHIVAAGVTNGHLAPMSLVPVSGVTYDGTSGFFVNSVTGDGGSNAFQVPYPLPAIQAISAPSVPADAGYFQNGVGYVFVLVGDPNPAQPTFLDDAGTFNVAKVHFLAFPTNPPFGAN